MFDVRFGAHFLSCFPLLDALLLEPLLALVLRHGAVQQLVGLGVDPGELLEGLGPDEADLVGVWVGEYDHLERHTKIIGSYIAVIPLSRKIIFMYCPLGLLFTSDVGQTF